MPTRTPDEPAAPPADHARDDPPPAPGIPSFASLRDPRRRSAVGVLFPPAPPPPPAPRSRTPHAAAPPPAAVRPPEWADLWHLGVLVTRSLAGLPVRVVRWQVHCLRSLVRR